jgi:hypothetical protein
LVPIRCVSFADSGLPRIRPAASGMIRMPLSSAP